MFLQRKCHFSHHKTRPEKEESAPSVSYPTQASLYRWNAEQLHCFSWLAVLFGGFDVGGLTHCDTKKRSERAELGPGAFAPRKACLVGVRIGAVLLPLRFPRWLLQSCNKSGWEQAWMFSPADPGVVVMGVLCKFIVLCCVTTARYLFCGFAPNLALKGLVWEVLEERNITNAFAQKVWRGEGVWVPAGF